MKIPILRRNHRAGLLFSLAALVAALGVIYACEQLGILQRSYLFHDGGLTILPNLVTLEPALTTLALILLSTVPIILPALLMGRMADQLQSAERRILTHSWNLRQILPAPEPRKEP